MKYIIYLLLIILLLALNVGFFSHLKIFGATSNLLLLLVVLTALHKEVDNFIFVATVSGIFLDMYTGVFVGSFSLAFLIIALLSRLMVDRIIVHDLNWKYVFFVSLGAIVFVDLFVWQYNIVVSKFYWSSYSFNFLSLERHIIPELVYSVLVLYPLYIFVNLVMLSVVELGRNRKHK